MRFPDIVAVAAAQGGGVPFAPADLGASLLAAWDAERADLITGASVSSWKDTVAAYDAVQATGANQPAYSATSFNGRPGVTFNGTSSELTYAATTGLPTSATACEMWALVDQTALAADATIRFIVAWGGTASTNNRLLRRSVSTLNRGSTSVGNGSTSVASQTIAVDFSGRHLIRGIVSATDTSAVIDGTAGGANAVVPATGTTRLRLGAGTANTAANFWQGVINCVFITDLLSAGQAAQMTAYLNARLA